MTNEQICSLQVGFERGPPAAAVGQGNGPDLAEASGAIDDDVECVGFAPKRGEKAFDLSLIGYVADMRFNVRKPLRDDSKAIRATCTNENPMALFGERMRDRGANPGASAGDQYAQRPARDRVAAPRDGSPYRLVDADFVGALACGGPGGDLEPAGIGAAD